ncbi:drug/metabolite transporter (DMT)-like permease [Paenibacillus phyllosphaerae]|uniref:Drug/metabolite transporter (DMT)-like permease n=1 Tax=Paenibacillus phyllosphaerae TaxID=274593 RepID=A0A7W5FMH4_9BACL|nr:EamA family transporter [Paenibacillus phyllosphaerae]MBB3110276.1 drug/metabolite transporter (DMT)-like permease [Paenibacillus phyllosphaerae]
MSKKLYVGLIIATTFMMGIAFPVGKIGLHYAPPFLLMGVRFVIAGGLLAWFARSKPQPKGGRQWLHIALIGLFQSAGVMGCAYYSMRWITSGESAIITSMNPLLVIIIGTLFMGASYRAVQWFGVAIGFVGVAVSFGLHVGVNPGSLLGLAGALCFATATLLYKRWGAALDRSVLAGYQMLFGGAALLLLSMLTETPRWDFNLSSIAVLFTLVAICSIAQFTLWYRLLASSDPAKTSAFLFLVPLFGVLSSWLLLNEQLHWYVGLGGALICGGIFLVNWEGKRGTISVHTSATHMHVKGGSTL